MLARAAAREDGDAERAAHGGGVVVVVVAGRRSSVEAADGDRDVEPGLRLRCRRPGLWLEHDAVLAPGRSVGSVYDLDLEAGRLRAVASRVASSWLVTSGTCVVVGPFETLSVIVVPVGARCRRRALVDDGPGRLVGVDVRARDREARALESPTRLVVRLPDHGRHADRASGPSRR